MGFTIVGIGEALFDCYADGRRLLGGAPFNFAVQANRIASRYGGRALAVTRVGDDELGREFLSACSEAPREGIQVDSGRPTGRVEVSVLGGEPHYMIEENVAWDFIENVPIRCDAVCFGTLAQRSGKSRESIQDFVGSVSGLRLFDVNLRQHYWDREVIEQGLNLANAAKLNEDEARVLSGLFGISDPGEMLGRFGLEWLVLTRGERGTAILSRHGIAEGTPARFEAAADADAVGAGDACAATVAVGLVCGWPAQRVVDMANRVGAFVASRRGALPPLPLDQLFEIA